jgi:hypothetical protein
MKKIGTALAVVSTLAMTAPASAGNPDPGGPDRGNPNTGKNAITCFAEPAEFCTPVSKTSARLNTKVGTGYGGVYIPGFNKSFYGVRTSLVTKLSNTVRGDTLGIDPRWSIPIDDAIDNKDGYTDYFLFAAFADCNNGVGVVDIINDPTCTLYRSDTNESFPNWAAFVSQNPNTYISAEDYYAFIIADLSGTPGVWTISNMVVGKPGN